MSDKKTCDRMGLFALLLMVAGFAVSAFFELGGNQVQALKYDLVGWLGFATFLVIQSVTPKE